MVEFLLVAGVTATDDDLDIAAKEDKEGGILETVLGQGARVDVAEGCISLPLYCAMSKSNLVAIRQLLAAGAPVSESQRKALAILGVME